MQFTTVPTMQDIHQAMRLVTSQHHYFLFVDPKINYDEECEYEIAMKEANKEQMAMAMAD